MKYWKRVLYSIIVTVALGWPLIIAIIAVRGTVKEICTMIGAFAAGVSLFMKGE